MFKIIQKVDPAPPTGLYSPVGPLSTYTNHTLTQTIHLHKPYTYTNHTLTQTIRLHKPYTYTNHTLTQTIHLHKHLSIERNLNPLFKLPLSHTLICTFFNIIL